jgi:hypothetical protein
MTGHCDLAAATPDLSKTALRFGGTAWNYRQPIQLLRQAL